MERTETMEETVGMELSETIVKLEHVKKAYKGNVLFTDLNFQVQRGESCAIVGANGSGKSVLLKMICGLVRPDDGNVIVRGEKVEDGKFPKDIGVILDNAGFLPNETGLKNLSIIASISKPTNNNIFHSIQMFLVFTKNKILPIIISDILLDNLRNTICFF